MRGRGAADRRVQHGQDRQHRDRPRGAGRDRRPRVPGVPPRRRAARARPSSVRVDRAATRAATARPFPGALHLWESEYLLRQPPTPSAPWTVITTVREPVAQAVSAFFHGGAPARAAGAASRRPTRSPTCCSPRAGSARRCAGSTGSSRPRSASTCSAEPFDPGRRPRRDRDAGGPGAAAPPGEPRRRRRRSLGRFLGLGGAGAGAGPQRGDHQGVRRAGTGSSSPRSGCLRAVLDQAYGSRYARHFYADSELERFRRRWADGSAAAAGSS